MVAVNSAMLVWDEGWPMGRCGWSENSAGWEPEVIAVWRHLSWCWFRVRFVCVLRAFCVRARHACMYNVYVAKHENGRGVVGGRKK